MRSCNIRDKLINKEAKVAYDCADDARGALERLRKKVDSSCFFHGGRTVKSFEPQLKLELELNEQAVERARERAGCFVLIARLPKKRPARCSLLLYRAARG